MLILAGTNTFALMLKLHVILTEKVLNSYLRHLLNKAKLKRNNNNNNNNDSIT
jgi:hypothetical protein